MANHAWLITGVAGFVGSNMAQHLLEQGETVIGIDNFYAGSQENLSPLLANKNFNFFELDICDPEIENIFKKHEITYVLHLAAIVSVPICEQNKDLANKVNVKGMQHLLSILKRYPAQQFIYASSSAIYGAAVDTPVKESATAKPLSIYGQTKVSNEQDAEHFNQETAIPCTGLRFFNLFGGNINIKNNYAAVIPLWVDAIKNNKTVTIYGDGTATRDFCYIDNIAQVIDCIRKTNLQGHHLLNIGTQKATSLNELFEILCNIYRKKVKPVYKPWRNTDILHSCADISEARRLINYNPNVDITVCLKKWLL